MNLEPKESILRPMAKRVRNHNKRTLREKKEKTTGQMLTEEASTKAKTRRDCNIAVHLLSGLGMRSFAASTFKTDVFDTTKRNEVLATVQDWVADQQEKDTPWLKKLDTEDIFWLMTSSDPVQDMRDNLISLPHYLSKVFDRSCLEVLPAVYNKDQTWLTLQWVVDGVENPFLSRPCQSLPCVASLRMGKPLPELVPLTTLEQYQFHLATGVSTEEWKNLLEERRQEPSIALTLYPLARDVWSQPKCLLCRMQDMFAFAIDPVSSRKSLRLADYQRCFSIQLGDLLPFLYLNHKDLTLEWVLEETGVLLPHLEIPLVSVLVRLMEVKESNVIDISSWYEK